MTLREKILVTIREINTHGGAGEIFKKYPVGGVFYGEDDAHTDESGRFMGTQFDIPTLNELKKYSPNKLLVCADFVTMKEQTVKAENQTSLGASGNLEDAYNWGKTIGMQMNDAGIDWALAPSIDMFFDPQMYLMTIGKKSQGYCRNLPRDCKGYSGTGHMCYG